MVILDGGEIQRPFGRRGYRTVTADATGTWVQKSLVPDGAPESANPTHSLSGSER